ncbi:F-box only protein 31-like [Pipistrellus kuhlii]|uniref:F-box only protein 31-like n=1 Tax=Pipistrellus kuhlii TaxID=59472 RepID=UPI00174F5CD7|nr:F-box only protein 31-like [Pipistrellus kuhlii]
MERSAFLCGACSSWGCRCQPRQGPGETVAAHSMQPPVLTPVPAPDRAEEHVEPAAAPLCCAGGGESTSPGPPSPPPRCSLQDLPLELLEAIFALLPVIDLPSLAQACAQFRSILRTDSIWRRRCREEYGACGNFQDLQAMGLSCREFYTKLLHPYRNILGLWRLDTEARRELLKVAVDGVGITGWKYLPPPNYPDVDVPMQWKPSFRIHLTERKSATVECLEDYSRPRNCLHYTEGSHQCHLTIQKDEFTIRCNHRMSAWFQSRQMLLDSRLLRFRDSDCLTYRRVYLPPSQPGDLIRPGFFKGSYHAFSLKVAVLSFHGKYARATKIGGDPIFSAWKETLEIHLLHRIQLPDVKILLRDFEALSHTVQEMDEQVIQEQQEEEGQGWQGLPQPGVREARAAALEEQPAHSFVLPEGEYSVDGNCPRTYRMCFYGVNIVHFYGSITPQRFPGIFILFDENHFGFLCVERRLLSLYSRILDTFKNVDAPSPQAFLEMLRSIQAPCEDLTWSTWSD